MLRTRAKASHVAMLKVVDTKSTSYRRLYRTDDALSQGFTRCKDPLREGESSCGTDDAIGFESDTIRT